MYFLLWNKELLLTKAMHTFNELQGIGDIVQESIPAIILTASKQAVRQNENTASRDSVREILPKRKESSGTFFVEKRTNPLTCNRGKRSNVNGSHCPPKNWDDNTHAPFSE